MSRRVTSKVPTQAKASFVLPSAMADCQKLLTVPLDSSDGNRAAPAKVDLATAFMEQTGVVLLNPEVAAKPASLVTRFLPALDKFLACTAINVHEEVDPVADPVKYEYLEQVKKTYANYQTEVRNVASACETWANQLHAHLERQSATRVVAPGEESIKISAMIDRLRRILDSLLERSKVLLAQLQRSFHEGSSLVSKTRVAPPVLYGDEMFSQTKGKKIVISAGRTSKSNSSEHSQKEMRTWLALWNEQIDSPASPAPMRMDGMGSDSGSVPERLPRRKTAKRSGSQIRGPDVELSSAPLSFSTSNLTPRSIASSESSLAESSFEDIRPISSIPPPATAVQTLFHGDLSPAGFGQQKRSKFTGGGGGHDDDEFSSFSSDQSKVAPPPPMDMPVFLPLLQPVEQMIVDWTL